MVTREAPPPGTVLGERYRVVRQLGAGAFGSVLEVEHVHTRHHRAMKLLHADAAAVPEVVERFLREASAAGRIGHPQIVETFDAGRFADGSPYLVMELLDGVTLRALLHRDRQLSVGLACELIAQAALGMHAAHLAGIVHRDLKPENLFVLAGPKVKILDFGVSRFSDPNELSITQSNMAMGTPLYMPPEQFKAAKDLTPAADIYSLGVVLYELLCGSPPFYADSVGALAIQVATTAPTPLAQRVSGLDPKLEAVIEKAISREAADRFQSAEAFAQALAPYRSTSDGAPLTQLEAAPVTAAAPDEPTFRPPEKATPMANAPSTAKADPARQPTRFPVWWPVAALLALVIAGGSLLRGRKHASLPGPILVLDAGGGDWRSALATEVIHRQLALSPGVQLVPLADAERFRREAKDWPAAGPTGKEISAARQQLGAGRVLVVSATERLIDVDGYLTAGDGAADFHRDDAVSGDDVSDSALKMGRDLRTLLELPAPKSVEDNALVAGAPHAIAQLYAEGRRALAEKDLRGAIDSLSRARAREPNNPWVLDALTAAYDEAGYDDLALKTAREATAAAKGAAPQPLALRIECREAALQRDFEALHLACGALITTRGDSEARLLYASGLARLERWKELDQALDGGTVEEQQSLNWALQRTEAARLRLDFAQEHQAGERLIELGKAAQSPSIQAAGYLAICEAERAEGHPVEAATACDTALQEFHFASDKVGEARARTGLGHVAQESEGALDSHAFGDPTKEYEKALELARAAGSQRDVIASELHLASVSMQRGERDKARDRLEAAEKEAQQIGSGDLEARTATELGEVLARLEQPTLAREAYARAIAAASRARLPGLEGFALHKVGRLDWQNGELPEARLKLERATGLLKESGSQDDRAFAAAYLADVLADQDELAAARASQAQARAFWAASPMQQLWVDADLLRYSFEAGEAVDAKAAEALVERFRKEETADATGEAIALALRALADEAPAKWADQAQKALAKEEAPDPDAAAWVKLALAESLVRAGKKADAQKLLAEVNAHPSELKRLTLWSELLAARLAGKDPARVAADAKDAGYLALARRAEKKQ